MLGQNLIRFCVVLQIHLNLKNIEFKFKFWGFWGYYNLMSYSKLSFLFKLIIFKTNQIILIRRKWLPPQVSRLKRQVSSYSRK